MKLIIAHSFVNYLYTIIQLDGVCSKCLQTMVVGESLGTIPLDMVLCQGHLGISAIGTSFYGNPVSLQKLVFFIKLSSHYVILMIEF